MAEIRYNHCLKISHSQNEIQNLRTCIGIYKEISKFSTQVTEKKEGREKEKNIWTSYFANEVCSNKTRLPRKLSLMSYHRIAYSWCTEKSPHTWKAAQVTHTKFFGQAMQLELIYYLWHANWGQLLDFFYRIKYTHSQFLVCLFISLASFDVGEFTISFTNVSFFALFSAG